MFYLRYESYEIRQGFNFYPRNDEGSIGCQMLFGRLRIEARWSKRTRRFRFGMWLREYEKFPETEELVYVPGQTEALKKLYEADPTNEYYGKKYEDWEHDPKLEKQREREQAERNHARDELRKAAQ